MARPFWSGQIQISLVSFGVKLFAATEAKSEIRFHQINRKSGERVHHQNVSAADEAPVEKDDIVKGYEYSKDRYIQIDPKEIENLRIASRKNLAIEQFVSLDGLDLAYFEKPYYVVPANDSQSEAFAVVRKALMETGKAGLGKIAFGGREHLLAVAASPGENSAGIMAYALRYGSELRSAGQYFSEIKTPRVDDEQLSLAKELIERKAGKFNPAKFSDTYETALRELIDAKLNHAPLPVEQKAPARGKVIDLMDALRRSVSPANEKMPPVPTGRTKEKPAKHGLMLLKATVKRAAKRRKSA